MYGGSLRRLLDQQEVQSSVALAWFHQICLGVEAAHDSALIHGDLKPENVLIDGREGISK